MNEPKNEVKTPPAPDVVQQPISDVPASVIVNKFEERSPDILQLVAALSSAQGAFQNVHKAAENEYFNSKYASLDMVVAMARPVLKEYGLAVTQLTNSRAGFEVAIRTVLIHTSGEYVSSLLVMKPKDMSPQGIGSAITYGRRYSYMAILGLVASDEDDDGNAGSDKKIEDKGKSDPSTPEQQDIVRELVARKGFHLESFEKKFGAIAKYSSERIAKAIMSLSKMADKPLDIVDNDQIAAEMEREQKEKNRKEQKLNPGQIEQLRGWHKGLGDKSPLKDPIIFEQCNVGDYELVSAAVKESLKESK